MLYTCKMSYTVSPLSNTDPLYFTVTSHLKCVKCFLKILLLDWVHCTAHTIVTSYGWVINRWIIEIFESVKCCNENHYLLFITYGRQIVQAEIPTKFFDFPIQVGESRVKPGRRAKPGTLIARDRSCRPNIVQYTIFLLHTRHEYIYVNYIPACTRFFRSERSLNFRR